MNFGDLFDSPWKVAIIAIVILVLFGSKKLPGAARSLGQSMRILKREVQGLHEENAEPAPAASDASARPAPAELTPAPAPVPSAADQQSQIEELQQQIRDMQRAAAMDPVASSKQDAQ